MSKETNKYPFIINTIFHKAVQNLQFLKNVTDAMIKCNLRI